MLFLWSYSLLILEILKIMIKNILLGIFLLCSAFSLQAQGRYDNVVGKWIVVEIYNKEKIAPEQLAQLNAEFINELTIEFLRNGYYEAVILGESYKGRWHRSENNKGITLYNSNSPVEIKVLELYIDDLLLKVGFSKFVMKKM